MQGPNLPNGQVTLAYNSYIKFLSWSETRQAVPDIEILVILLGDEDIFIPYDTENCRFKKCRNCVCYGLIAPTLAPQFQGENNDAAHR